MPETPRSTSAPLFKTYNQNQLMLLPPSLDELIPENHLVRVVNGAIDKMNTEPLIESYKGGGTTSYHPKMLLKILVYAYISQIYSSRRIAKALRENIYFMWLAGNNRPDFRTINLFRSSRLKQTVEQVFASLLEQLIESGYIKLEHYFVDGTKLRANASKYSYIWAKNTQRYSSSLQQKIKTLLEHIEAVNDAEDAAYGDRDLEEMGEEAEIDSERLEKIVKDLDDKLATKEKSEPQLKGTKRTLERDYLPRLRKYEQQKQMLSGRNSCSKTDKDATFFRFKNRDLLPAYNVLIGTENQFILNWSVHQHPTDTVSLIPHLEKLSRLTDHKPGACIGDSGFGSEENYRYLKRQRIKNYLKYSTFHREPKLKRNRFHHDNFAYDPETDCYRCPEGKTLSFKEQKERRTVNGYPISRRIYQCEDCSGCAYASECKKGDTPRTIHFNRRWERYRAQAKQNLNSAIGVQLRRRRGTEPESVFGHIKHNRNFNRFKLRGLDQVNVEMALIAMAHNFVKMFNLNNLEPQPA